jgi:hypothetical protein
MHDYFLSHKQGYLIKESNLFRYDHIYPTGNGVLNSKIKRGVKLTTQLHVVPSLGMRGAKPPLPYTSSLCGVLLKHEE